MMQSAEVLGSTIDLPASPYTVIAFGKGDGIVVTHQGPMTIDEAATLFIAKLEAFDWTAFESQGREIRHETFGQLFCEYEEILDLTSLVAEINLYEARLLWSIKVPEIVGMPRMLAKTHERVELRYIKNLAAQRTLTEGELAEHLLEQGAFMSQWAEERTHLIERTDAIARLAASA